MSHYQLDFDKLQFRITPICPMLTFNGYQLSDNPKAPFKLEDNKTNYKPKTIGPKELVRWLDEV